MTTAVATTFSEKVMSLRKALASSTIQEVVLKGWNQTTAAENLDRSQPDISDMSRGVVSRLSLATLLDTASRVEIPLAIRGGVLRAPIVRPMNAEELRTVLMKAMADVMSQRQWGLNLAAAELETNTQRISDIRSGRGSRVSVESCIDLAQLLGIVVDVDSGKATVR